MALLMNYVMALLMNYDSDISLLDVSGADSSETGLAFFGFMIMEPNVCKNINAR